MTTKVNGHVVPGQHLSSASEYITITTTVNILVNGDVAGGTPVSQTALDKLIEVVSLRAQPVVLGLPTLSGGVYTVRLLTEHANAWSAAVPTLHDVLGLAGVDYGFGAGTNTVTFTVGY